MTKSKERGMYKMTPMGEGSVKFYTNDKFTPGERVSLDVLINDDAGGKKIVEYEVTAVAPAGTAYNYLDYLVMMHESALIDRKQAMMAQPFSVTLSDVAWNIVLMSLDWTQQELGKDCENPKLVRQQIVEQLKRQGKGFADGR